jgi:hypothetical protein
MKFLIPGILFDLRGRNCAALPFDKKTVKGSFVDDIISTHAGIDLSDEVVFYIYINSTLLELTKSLFRTEGIHQRFARIRERKGEPSILHRQFFSLQSRELCWTTGYFGMPFDSLMYTRFIHSIIPTAIENTTPEGGRALQR